MSLTETPLLPAAGGGVADGVGNGLATGAGVTVGLADGEGAGLGAVVGLPPPSPTITVPVIPS